MLRPATRYAQWPNVRRKRAASGAEDPQLITLRKLLGGTKKPKSTVAASEKQAAARPERAWAAAAHLRKCPHHHDQRSCAACMASLAAEQPHAAFSDVELFVGRGREDLVLGLLAGGGLLDVGSRR